MLRHRQTRPRSFWMRSAADLARLHRACFETPRPWSEPDFAEMLASPFAFLCDADHGFLLGRVIADEAELLTIAVDPLHRNRGAGMALVASFLDTAKQRGATTTFLEVSAENPAAIALYAKAGFARVGLRKGYYLDPQNRKVDALVLSRQI